MIVMSVDLGKARTGIAASDKDENFAFPKTVIAEHNTEKLIAKICDCAKEYGAVIIVVGLPKNMDGSLGERAKECTEIAGQIEQKSGISTVMFDERCTTVLSASYLNITDTKGKKRKQVIDAVAATVILEDYLKSSKK
ncbi:MAG: Holliday junction resolvase RuvX [Clostridia bacterium]|nr:Holliday junction resolvase RuvX [Clostridia bacterium]